MANLDGSAENKANGFEGVYMLIDDEICRMKKRLAKEENVREKIALENEILYLKSLIPELNEIFVEVMKI